jgi:hypothetical protein
MELDLHRAVGRTEEDEDVDFPPRLNESVSGWWVGLVLGSGSVGCGQVTSFPIFSSNSFCFYLLVFCFEF